jgi:2-oxo-4-hydroxy-4-carboxy--5-ureidoimidazoline (OHCU) decarboxylase
VRELPRQLSVEQLAELFEGRTRFVERLAERENPLDTADEVAQELSDDEKVEALNMHPAIGGTRFSPRSAIEQGQPTNDDPAVLTELAYLNRVYEEKFGFRFVVFVNRRPKSELVPILQERLGRTREDELETALSELIAIARDRWIHT